MGWEVPEAPQSVLSNEETAVVFSRARIKCQQEEQGNIAGVHFLWLPSRRLRSDEKLETLESGRLLAAYLFGGEWPSWSRRVG